jgi:intein/homing endonuclease
MKFDLLQIQKSGNDIRRNITLPPCLTSELAEFLGAFIGDGHLGLYSGRYKNGNSYRHYDIRIAGHVAEKSYLDFLNGLFKKLFNATMYYTAEHALMGLALRKDSKGIVQFLHGVCDVPLNNKCEFVKIPKIIKEGKTDEQYAFLRGLFDTDFSLTFKNKNSKGHSYPVIKGSFLSRTIIQDLEQLFMKLEFKHSVIYDVQRYDKRYHKYYIQHSIYLNGRKNLQRWIEKIGSSNVKFQRKIKRWLDMGFCEPGY